MDMTGWRHLPRAGGLLDQDEQEMLDVMQVDQVVRWLSPQDQAELGRIMGG